MVIASQVSVGTIISFIGGYGAKFLYDEITRRREANIEQKNKKIDWYNDLRALCIEIRLGTDARMHKFSYFNDKANLSKQSLEDILLEEDIENLQNNLSDMGCEDPKEFIESYGEQLAFEEWHETKEAVKQEIQSDMKLYEERVRKQIVEYPDDVSKNLLKETTELLRLLNAAGTVGRLNDEVEEKIKARCENLVEQCSQATSELEQ